VIWTQSASYVLCLADIDDRDVVIGVLIVAD
jgi:hypothetical protein